MEFYPAFSDLLGRVHNPFALVFLPVFAFTILAEAWVLRVRQGRYPWRSAAVSTMMAIGHVVTRPRCMD